MQCQLCLRECYKLTTHHLIPRQYTRRKKLSPGVTVEICPACHRQIHVLFTHQQLALELNSLETLSEHPDMIKFLNWLRKQPGDRRIAVKRRR
ncbi:MAG: HNH endonuclease [Spirulinaceae cyanobacterium]